VNSVPGASGAVFLSYASQDAQAASQICEALRAAGIEVWFDQSELRGGDAWDVAIRRQIKTCALFVPVVSHNTHERAEGYFRLEWKLAVDRSHFMSSDRAFLLPVVIDETSDDDARVPERFREVQWMRLPGGVAPGTFVEHVRRLVTGEFDRAPLRRASIQHAPISTAPERLSAKYSEAGQQHGHAHLPPLRFIEELKRRHVGRVAVLYVVVIYVVLEVFEMFFHLLDMPPWTGRAAVLIAILGFPIALLVAWAYEIAPDGLKPTDEMLHNQSVRAQTGRRLDRAIVVLMAVALAYFITDKFWLSKHLISSPERTAAAEAQTTAVPTPNIAPPAQDESVAVLPFADMSERHDQEYFSDGLAEEVLDRLAHIPNLRVIARTSSFSFKGKADDIPTIAKQLDVSHVLEGSVRKSGSHLRVTAQLIRAKTGVREWSQTYDSELSDVFKVQDQIASAVSDALRIQIAPSVVALRSTKSPEAQSLLMEAKYFYARLNEANLIHAVELARKAVDLDPNYSDAWASLSVVYITLEGYLPSQGYREKAKDAATHAIASDPSNGIGHAVMVYVLENVGDIEGMKREVEAAARDPRSDALTANARGHYEIVIGNWRAAIETYQKALIDDPVNPFLLANLAICYTGAHRFDDADKAFRHALTVAPDFDGLHGGLALVLLWQGDVGRALSEAQLEHDSEAKAFALVPIYRALGRIEDSNAVIFDMERRLGANQPTAVADVYALAGNKARAMQWLRRALERGDPGLQTIRGDFYLYSLSEVPAYQDLLRDLKVQ
jgi:adenylate cyclase